MIWLCQSTVLIALLMLLDRMLTFGLPFAFIWFQMSFCSLTELDFSYIPQRQCKRGGLQGPVWAHCRLQIQVITVRGQKVQT